MALTQLRLRRTLCSEAFGSTYASKHLPPGPWGDEHRRWRNVKAGCWSRGCLSVCVQPDLQCAHPFEAPYRLELPQHPCAGCMIWHHSHLSATGTPACEVCEVFCVCGHCSCCRDQLLLLLDAWRLLQGAECCQRQSKVAGTSSRSPALVSRFRAVRDSRNLGNQIAARTRFCACPMFGPLQMPAGLNNAHSCHPLCTQLSP